MTIDHARRRFLERGAGAALVLPFVIGGCERRTTPSEAHRAGVTLRTLTSAEGADLAVLCEALVPGSRTAGAVEYIDHQLSVALPDSMLMIKYLRVPAPFVDFYRGGLAALAATSQRRLGASFASIDGASRDALVSDLVGNKLTEWAGPPAAFFSFVVRSDAIDVTYGTQAGFAALEVPYMAHIAPTSEWGA